MVTWDVTFLPSEKDSAPLYDVFVAHALCYPVFVLVLVFVCDLTGLRGQVSFALPM